MNYKEAREAKGMTLVQVAELSGYGIGTISDLERKGLGSDRLKQKLTDIYIRTSTDSTLRETAPKNSGDSDSEIWRRRALLAEKDLADLRNSLRQLLAPKPTQTTAQISPDKDADEAALQVVRKMGESYDRKH